MKYEMTVEIHLRPEGSSADSLRMRSSRQIEVNSVRDFAEVVKEKQMLSPLLHAKLSEYCEELKRLGFL
jgi:hypothetical protein